MNEILLAIKTYPIWSYLSGSDLKNRFRRSALGLLWPVLQQLLFSLGAGYIWSSVFSIAAKDFIPFLTVGFAIWGYIAACMTEGCMSFVIAHGYLKQLVLPQSIFIFRTLYTQLIYFFIAMLVALVVLIIFDQLALQGFIISLPGFFLLIIFGYGSIGTFAYLGLKYRDLPHALASILNIIFVVTPVIYPTEVLVKKGLIYVALANPLVSLIDIVRVPLLTNNFPSLSNYLIATFFSCILVYFRWILSKKWGPLVVFWS